MNVLLIGSGGREHALAWAIAKSAELETLYAAPGNAGIAEVATVVDLPIEDHDAVIAFCREKSIGLVVVGPEAPLVAGLVDDLEDAGILAFGPSREAARLEGSKRFTKELCADADIPTARYRSFDKLDAARLYVRVIGAPIVIKADGLAAGKGVVVASSVDEALEAVDACFEGAFGEAGAEVVIEQCLVGEEASFFALTDGKTVVPLATAQDHKRVGEGDSGPNTGGMGAYSPAPVMTPDLVAATMAEIVVPTVRAMAERGTPYKGVLYAGLMLTSAGPKLIEYNVRFGDPECQVLMMRLNEDLLPLLVACAKGQLQDRPLAWRDETALTVVMASRGYPGPYAKGTEIRNLDDARALANVEVFHAGTTEDGDRLLATGGRVLNVTALGAGVAEAQALAYEAVDQIDWPEGFCRRDIGWRALGEADDPFDMGDTISAAVIEAAVAEIAAAANAAQAAAPVRAPEPQPEPGLQPEPEPQPEPDAVAEPDPLPALDPLPDLDELPDGVAVPALDLPDIDLGLEMEPEPEAVAPHESTEPDPADALPPLDETVDLDDFDVDFDFEEAFKLADETAELGRTPAEPESAPAEDEPETVDEKTDR